MTCRNCPPLGTCVCGVSPLHYADSAWAEYLRELRRWAGVAPKPRRRR